ncbi:hypothetical protein FB451DRAFT_1419236 [Mycena latifolia]|nr:hypothetical protein FB451DRAFT_1419236 [Mycena latifolia]
MFARITYVTFTDNLVNTLSRPCDHLRAADRLVREFKLSAELADVFCSLARFLAHLLHAYPRPLSTFCPAAASSLFLGRGSLFSVFSFVPVELELRPEAVSNSPVGAPSFISSFSPNLLPAMADLLFNLADSITCPVFVIRNGASCIAVFSNAMAHFKGNRFSMCRLSETAYKTLRWWEQKLLDASRYRQPCPLGVLRDFGVCVDASTSWGVAVVIWARWPINLIPEQILLDSVEDLQAIDILSLILTVRHSPSLLPDLPSVPSLAFIDPFASHTIERALDVACSSIFEPLWPYPQARRSGILPPNPATDRLYCVQKMVAKGARHMMRLEA